MEGNTFTRILRLIKHLSSEPKHIPKYFKYSIFNNKEPLEVELPWTSWGAIEFLDEYEINCDLDILELGGGGSTIFFAKKGAHVTCFESNDKWSEILKKKRKEKSLNNIELFYLPYDCKDLKSFSKSYFFQAIGSKTYDIIFVDNYEEELNIRPECFYKAEKCIKPGGIIILDDSWRYSDVRKQNSAKSFKIYKSIGPCRYGVTTTDIYFY